MAKADLIAKAQEMGIELTGKETVAQLEEMLKPVVKPEEQPPVDNDHIEEGSERFSEKTSFDVYNADGGFVRTYTLEIHGENAEALANEFAAHTGGSVR